MQITSPHQPDIMARMRTMTRRMLLGDDAAWGATLATGPLGIGLLACLALLMHVLDLASGLHMMLVYGVGLEQNPLARAVMTRAGPLGLVELKLGVVTAGILLLVRTARLGRPRLARNCLLVAIGIGLLGWTSNLVG